MPVMIGDGIPVLPPGATKELVLAEVKRLPTSGIVMLAYSVAGSGAPAPRIRYIKSGKSKARPRNVAKKRPAKTRART
jgi:hypothetical protein